MARTYTRWTQTLEERFASKYEVDEATGCWLWTAATFADGYGAFREDGKTVKAHRRSYEQRHGPIPGGLFVLHRCDVKRCVNPNHLFIGTQLDNMRDMAEKGRAPSRKNECAPNPKLTIPQVREIRSRYAKGDIMQKDLAAEYGVHPCTVMNIIHRQTWAEIV